MDQDRLNMAIRIRKEQDRLGLKEGRCFRCGEWHLEALLEFHHMPARRYGDTGQLTCKNCHARLTLKQKGHPAPLSDVPTQEERDAHLLYAIADVYVMQAEDVKAVANRLMAQAAMAVESRSQEAGNRV